MNTLDRSPLNHSYEIGVVFNRSSRHLFVSGHRRTDRLRVLFKSSPRVIPTAHEQTLLRNEFNILQSLSGIEGVVQTYGLESCDERLVLVLQHLEARSLRDVIRERRLPIVEVLRLASKLCDSLGRVHSKGIIHGDINPDNILFDRDAQTPYLVDFGSAAKQGDAAQRAVGTRLIQPTLAYISPEQTGRIACSVGRSSDLYSLGATIYELLTGSPPFDETDPLELIHCHIARRPPALSERDSSIPLPLSRIVLKLLAKPPDARYQSAAGLKADLDDCLRQLQASGRIEEFPLARSDRRIALSWGQHLYGRQRETAVLQAALARVIAGGSELVMVKGYAGIGKSALVLQMQPEVNKHTGYFVVGKCDQYHRNQPFTAVSQALRNLLNLVITERPADLPELKQHLAAKLHGNEGVLYALLPELEQILGPRPPVPDLGPAESQSRFDLVLQELLAAFCHAGHPLVLFLDDLQWADPASIRLLRLWLTDPRCTHLLLVAAYRDIDVDAAHPLHRTLDLLQDDGVRVQELHLGPLTQTDVTALLMDCLESHAEKVSALGELVFSKTRGNPFFVNQVLRHLARDGLLSWDEEASAWTWDITNIHSHAVDDDVADFIVHLLHRLTAETQLVLRLAACIGHKFDLGTLSTVAERSLDEVLAALWDALNEGMVQPIQSDGWFEQSAGVAVETSQGDESDYRFLHDRVQQAAYSLTPASDRPLLRLRIGRLLRAKGGLDDPAKRFEVVGHMNEGAALIEDVAERLELARLNLDAGRQAKSATAYASAVEVLRAGLRLLPADAWQSEYAMTLGLHAECAECEYLAGNFSESESLFRESLRSARDRLDSAALYSVRMRLYQVAGRYAEGVELAAQALSLFEIHLPLSAGDAQEQFQVEQREIPLHMADRSIEALLDAPLMLEPAARAVLTLLADCAPCAYISRPELFPLVTMRMLNWSLRHGNSEASCFAYSAYALMLTNFHPQDAYRFSVMSLRLNEKLADRRLRGTLLHLHGDHVQPWMKHLREDLPVLEQAFIACQAAGDSVYANYVAFEAPWQYYEVATPLDELHRTCDGFAAFARRTNNQAVYQTIRLEQQFLRAFQHEVDPNAPLSSADFDEAQALRQISAANFGCGTAFYHVMRLILAYSFDQPTEALAQLISVEPVCDAVLAMPIEATLAFYRALTHLACVGPIADSAGHILEARKQEQKLARWAKSCPDNFRHKWLLVQAEIERVVGSVHHAHALYEEAIDEAQRGGFLQYQALAHERAASSWLSQHRRRAAANHVLDAIGCYERWGATEKVRQLRRKFASLEAVAGSTGEGSTAPRSVEWFGKVLDVHALLRAASAISRELVLERALEQVMRTILTCAGARRGALFLERDGALFLASTISIDPDTVQVNLATPLGECSDLPQSIIEYAARSNEALLLSEPQHDDRFKADSYVKGRTIQALLCMGLRQQGRLISVLYLENSETRSAFTSERVELLSLLGAQAAVAIQNAVLFSTMQEARQRAQRLNETLEQQVQQRTQELSEKNAELIEAIANLKRMQQQLVHQQKLASLGTLTAGIAHELKNPLNFINNFAETALMIADKVKLQLSGEEQPQTTLNIDRLAKSNQRLRDCVAKIHEHGQRANQVINGMLQHARNQPGAPEWTDMNALVAEVITLVQPSGQSKAASCQVSLESNYDPAVGKVRIVRSEIARVFINIFSNSFYAVYAKHARNPPDFKPRIFVYTRSLGDRVEVAIWDNGIGIPRENLSKLFTPFFTTKSPGEGTGLGLSISHDIVVQGHRGQISMASVEGEYSEFVVMLPRDASAVT